jgi:hypothetical protein
MLPETAGAGDRGNAETGSRNIARLAARRVPDATSTESGQQNPTEPSASAEAIAAANDLAFESLVETGSLAESFARSLVEAAWRGDRSTVEVHLRQLRLCVLAGNDIFKRLDSPEAGRAAA